MSLPAYDPSNVFAKILRGDIPCAKLYEDEDVLAFSDITPAAPVHALVVPKQSFISFADFMAQSEPDACHRFFKAVHHIATEILKLEPTGFRLITNHGADASQSVPHFHVHILGGTYLGGLLPSDTEKR